MSRRKGHSLSKEAKNKGSRNMKTAKIELGKPLNEKISPNKKKTVFDFLTENNSQIERTLKNLRSYSSKKLVSKFTSNFSLKNFFEKGDISDCFNSYKKKSPDKKKIKCTPKNIQKVYKCEILLSLGRKTFEEDSLPAFNTSKSIPPKSGRPKSSSKEKLYPINFENSIQKNFLINNIGTISKSTKKFANNSKNGI